jgi:hypothetical protein
MHCLYAAAKAFIDASLFAVYVAAT